MKAVGRCERQRVLVKVMERPDLREPMFATDFEAAGDDAARRRVVVDQVASLTDGSAAAWHQRLC